MEILKGLLARYAHIQAPEATLRKAFIQAVHEIVGFELEERSVRIVQKTAKLQTPSVVRNEIRLNQQRILKRVADEVGDTHALTAIL